MSTPHEVARDLRERMESAKRAASSPEAGSVYAFEYLLSACEAACARLDLQAGSGEQTNTRPPLVKPQFGSPDHSEGDSATGSTAPAAGEGTRCTLGVGCDEYGACYAAAHGEPGRCGREPVVSDAEAEATADAACGAPVDSAVPRAYVGPGPARLAARFPIDKRGGR